MSVSVTNALEAECNNIFTDTAGLMTAKM